MNEKIFSRTEPIIGGWGLEKLKNSTMCLFGVGGVGSYAFEALVRSGVGSIVIVDGAKIDVTNINRQIHAAFGTVGRYKVDVETERAADINPEAVITAYREYVDENNIATLIPENADYILDAVDDVKAKTSLAQYAFKKNIPIISCMGAGNKIHPDKLRIDDIFSTREDPLARVMRNELRKKGVPSLEVVWSDEKPVVGSSRMPVDDSGKKVPASTAYVPSSAGLLMASRVINRLTGLE
jgi:tRNA A37 threonylcarbamoyladenosine dehydratase